MPCQGIMPESSAHGEQEGKHMTIPQRDLPRKTKDRQTPVSPPHAPTLRAVLQQTLQVHVRLLDHCTDLARVEAILQALTGYQDLSTMLKTHDAAMVQPLVAEIAT